MTRDETTAALVNLTPTEKPQDIYQTIADAVQSRVTEEAAMGDERAKLLPCIDRKLLKK